MRKKRIYGFKGAYLLTEWHRERENVLDNFSWKWLGGSNFEEPSGEGTTNMCDTPLLFF